MAGGIRLPDSAEAAVPVFGDETLAWELARTLRSKGIVVPGRLSFSAPRGTPTSYGCIEWAEPAPLADDCDGCCWADLPNSVEDDDNDGACFATYGGLNCDRLSTFHEALRLPAAISRPGRCRVGGPTHFVGVRLPAEARLRVEEVQRELCKRRFPAELAAAAVPVERFHLTLLLIRLYLFQLPAASRALATAVATYTHEAHVAMPGRPRSAEVTLSGLGCFPGVLWARVVDRGSLERLHAALLKAFRAEGFPVYGEGDEDEFGVGAGESGTVEQRDDCMPCASFTPHVTIAKASQAARVEGLEAASAARRRIYLLAPALTHAHIELGELHLSAGSVQLELADMRRPQADGYYNVLTSEDLPHWGAGGAAMEPEGTPSSGTRSELIAAVFGRLLHSNGSLATWPEEEECVETRTVSTLGSAELRPFAEFTGFDGDHEDWVAEYAGLCNELGLDPCIGVDLQSFAQIVDDESDRGCYCSDLELRQLAGLAPMGNVSLDSVSDNAGSAEADSDDDALVVHGLGDNTAGPQGLRPPAVEQEHSDLCLPMHVSRTVGASIETVSSCEIVFAANVDGASGVHQHHHRVPWAHLQPSQPPNVEASLGARLQWRIHCVDATAPPAAWYHATENFCDVTAGRHDQSAEAGGGGWCCEHPLRPGILDAKLCAPLGAQLPLQILWPLAPAPNARLQLMPLNHCLDLCIEHRADPLQCFCPTLRNEDGTVTLPFLRLVRQLGDGAWESGEDYISAWRIAVEVEALTGTVAEGDGPIIFNVAIHWKRNAAKLEGSFVLSAELADAHLIRNKLSGAWLCLRRGCLMSRSGGGDAEGGVVWVGHGHVEDVREVQRSDDIHIDFCLVTTAPPAGPPPRSGPFVAEILPCSLSHRYMQSALQSFADSSALLRTIVLYAEDPGVVVDHRIAGGSANSAGVSEEPAHRGLNTSQCAAVCHALRRPVTLIHGPPGTGKTRTAAILAVQFARANIERGTRSAVLYCAPGNRAVDVAAGYIAEFGRHGARAQEREPDPDDVCAVCLGERPDAVTPCGHAFHRSCILRAIITEPRCPLCRRTLRSLDAELNILRIYGSDHERADFALPRRFGFTDANPRQLPSVPEAMRPFALHWRVHGERAVQQAYDELSACDPWSDQFVGCRKRYWKVRQQARRRQIKRADVILTTCTGAMCKWLSSALTEEGFEIPQVIVDEAGQSAEPETLCALTAAGTRGVQHIVLCGDHRQLRPVVKSSTASELLSLTRSLFERLAARQGLSACVFLLRQQYRMHPLLNAFPSGRFYGGLVHDDDSVQRRPVGVMLHPQTGAPLAMALYHSVSPEVEQPTATRDRGAPRSRFNPGEAERAVAIAEDLVAATEQTSVAVISWYSAQVAELRKRLHARGLRRVHVGSIATAQGSEWDYVVLSTVRSSSSSSSSPLAAASRAKGRLHDARRRLGFLADEHLLNVGITRSRLGLVVLGDVDTLSLDSVWTSLVKHCENTGALIGCAPRICVGQDQDLAPIPNEQRIKPSKENKLAPAFDDACARGSNASAAQLSCSAGCGISDHRADRGHSGAGWTGEGSRWDSWGSLCCAEAAALPTSTRGASNIAGLAAAVSMSTNSSASSAWREEDWYRDRNAAVVQTGMGGREAAWSYYSPWYWGPWQ